MPDMVVDRLRRGPTARLDDAHDRLDGAGNRLTDHDGRTRPGSAGLVHRQLPGGLITVETLDRQRLYDDHTISDTTGRSVHLNKPTPPAMTLGGHPSPSHTSPTSLNASLTPGAL